MNRPPSSLLAALLIAGGLGSALGIREHRASEYRNPALRYTPNQSPRNRSGGKEPKRTPKSRLFPKHTDPGAIGQRPIPLYHISDGRGGYAIHPKHLRA